MIGQSFQRFYLEEKEGEKVYLSVAKVNLYDKHQKDLKLLKTALSYDREIYRAFFQKPGKINYPAYVGYTIQAGDKIAVKRCSHDEFVKEVKKLIEKSKTGWKRTGNLRIHFTGDRKGHIFTITGFKR